MSQGRRTFQLKVRPTYGVTRPAAIDLMFMTGFFAFWMIEATVSISTCIRKPTQLKIWIYVSMS